MCDPANSRYFLTLRYILSNITEKGGSVINNIFLTGKIQMGKSTLINRILAGFPGKVAGFRTLPYVENGQINGFYIESISEKPRPKELAFIARCRDNDHWEAFPLIFEQLGTSILKNSLAQEPDLIILDELGFFERNAMQFHIQVFEVLNSPIPVLGVLKQYDDKFLNAIRRREDVELITITERNREEMFQILEKRLEEVMSSVGLDGKKPGVV
ncbi:hypothetical protein DCMF_09155 [Candidatus Formimonas warabiya]|uniref:AAA family ATPase n=2 Tax=Formimonas warabiya TaxID=1761012 RepID=A0A3G1KR45_FORW1|nr:nucleoside-triphosphatase [Candidatus Formimonas warabiya]ATW24916.1 hypothetical protein DCMF_09155 [Candidatus Formimonas warabiya]